MKVKTLIISAVTAAIAGFLLGFVWYGIVFQDAYKTDFSGLLDRGEDMSLPLLMIGFLVFSFVFSFLYEKWANHNFNVLNGTKFGIILGLIPGLGMALITYSTSKLLSPTGLVLDACWGIVCFGMMGAIVAFLYKKTSSSK